MYILGQPDTFLGSGGGESETPYRLRPGQDGDGAELHFAFSYRSARVIVAVDREVIITHPVYFL